jgi:DNA invertase Pin-like site-specific DNA recombinase
MTKAILRSRKSRATARRTAVGAFGYTSVPHDVALDGEEARAQRQVIERACEERGVRLVDFVCEREKADGAERPGLTYVLEQIGTGAASCLVVSDLERLSRHVSELATLIDRLERGRVRLIVVDVGLDTDTPAGRLAVTPVEGVEELPDPAPTPAPEGPDAPAAAEAAVPVLIRAIGYASAPADVPGSHELDKQRAAIEQLCERLGAELADVVCDREPARGKAIDRAGLSYLIGQVAQGEANCVVVAGLERISRSVAELGMIVQWLERNSVRLVAAEQQLDTASPTGRMTARTLASVAGWERERLSERTARGLAAARAKRHEGSAQGDMDWGAVKRRIAKMRADGMTLQAIADVLNDEGVPTQRGAAKWRTSSVQTAAGYKRRTRPSKLGDLPLVDSPAGSGDEPDSDRS